jgi:class 3 adenylate cyclase
MGASVAAVLGLGVHIGQRGSSLASPGEILVSRTVVDLLAGSGLAFADRGEHQLKGVPGNVGGVLSAPTEKTPASCRADLRSP